MKIITLGSCCKKSKQNHENAVIAAKNCVQWTSFMKDVGRLIVVLWRICATVQNIMNTQ